MSDPHPNATAANGQITRVEVPRTSRPRMSWDAKLGIALIVLGFTALTTMGTPTIASVMRLGWLLLVAGMVEIAHGLRVQRSDEFLLHSVPGVTGAPIGLLIATHTEAGYTSWVLLFASYFTILGLFELLSALRLRFPGWRWAVLAGVITLLLGTMLWVGWSWLSLWFIGVALGCSLISRGVMFLVWAKAVREGAGQSDSLSQSKATAPIGICSREQSAMPTEARRRGISSFKTSNLSQSAFRR